MKRVQLHSLLNVTLLLLVLVVSFLLSNAHPTKGIPLDAYITSDVLYADGRTAHFDTKNFDMVNRGDMVTIHLRLPEEPLAERPVLCFYIYHSITEIWCDGVLLDSYGADLDARGDMVGNAQFLTALPAAAMGGEVTIIFRITEDNAFNCINQPLLYPGDCAYLYYIEPDLSGFLVAFPLAFLGLMVLLILILNGKMNVNVRRGSYIAVFAILSSLWIITSSGMQNIVGWNGYFWTQLEYISLSLLVIPPLLYIYETESKGTLMRRIFAIDICVNVAAFVLFSILHFTNLLHYCRTLLYTHVLILISGSLMLYYAMTTRNNERPSARILFNGMTILFLVGLFDVLRFNAFKYISFLPKLSLPTDLPLGLLFFVIYFLRAYLSELSEQQHQLLTAQALTGQLSAMLSHIPAGICVFSLNEPYRIIDANDPFYRLMGYEKQEAIAHGITDIYSCTPEEDHSRIRAALSTLVKGTADVPEIEVSALHRDGRQPFALVRSYIDWQAMTATISTVDISYRKQVEDDLRVSEQRYRLALKQSGKVFFFVDIPTQTMHLPDELAQAFGLPNKVDNMPDSFIAQGLVEPRSEDAYRSFFAQIFAGQPSGNTIIAGRMPNTTEDVLWYRIAFTSAFDANGAPASAIITYEDLNQKHQAEIEQAWTKLDLATVSDSAYVVTDFNLTSGKLIRQTGSLFLELPHYLVSYEDINNYMLSSFVYEADTEAYRTFMDRRRLLRLFSSGVMGDSIEYRSLQHGSVPRWTRITVQFLSDPYSGDILGRFLFLDIHKEKTGELQIRDDLDKLKQELENSRIKIMINQMQPHFLYNALSAIQIIIKSDPDYAYQLIYDFTVHLRSSIKALSSDAPISFREELKNIKAYLNIERMRFGDVLKVNYEIDCDDFCVIPLSIQPLAENAARHGIYPKGEDGGTVTIRTYENASAYIIEVEDDGVGFDVDEIMHRKSESVGLKNLTFRLRSLMKADVSIHSRVNIGTKVTVSIPKDYEEYHTPDEGEPS